MLFSGYLKRNKIVLEMLKITISFLMISFMGFMQFCSKRPLNEPNPNFKIEPGFTIDLVASEPLIKDPVDLEFDENGHAFVLEMPGYPFEDSQSRIIQLSDENKDGIFDTRNEYANNLNMASSLLLYKDGILVASPPYLLHLRDQNKDMKVEKIDTLMGGFSTGNLQHNYNGLVYGLDGWIYAANGGNSGAPYWWPDSINKLPLRGQDIRFHIDQKKLERLGESSGGFGLTMDHYGHFFETHNTDHIQHLVFPDRYIKNQRLAIEHTLQNSSDHDENGLARIYPIGEQETRVNHPEQSGHFSGACGITFYGGNAFGERFNNTLWIADVVLNLLHVDKMTAEGAGYKAMRVLPNSDFLASSDRAHRPVNMKVGYDGALYVIDMYREVIEHPEWIPDDIEATQNLNAGKDKGRIYRITNSGTSFINKVEGRDYVKMLSSENQETRMVAHRKLTESPNFYSDLKELINVLAMPGANDYARLHSAWILSIYNQLPLGYLKKLISDPNPGIRENAIQIAEKSINDSTSLIPEILEKLNDDDARVRMQAALTLSMLTESNALKHKEDILRYSSLSAQKKGDKYNIAALTLANKPFPHELFAKIANDSTQTELLLSLAGLSTSSNEQVAHIFTHLKDKNIAAAFDPVIQSITTHLKYSEENKKWSPLINELEKNAKTSRLIYLNALRKKIGLPSSPNYLKLSLDALTKLNDKSLDDEAIMENILLISSQPANKQIPILVTLLANTRPVKVQEAALRQLNEIKETAVGKELVNIWPSLGPQARVHAGNILLYNKIHHDALLTGIENKKINIGEMNFDLERRRTLLWWSGNDEIKKRAAALFKDSGVTNRKEALDKMKPAIHLEGNGEKGKIVFSNQCGSCHIYGSLGNEVGPNLTEISRKSKETLLHDIVDPNAATDTKYINHKVELKNGDVHLGIISKENDQEIAVKKMGGAAITIAKSDIKEFKSLGTSLMMEGLESSISMQEMADLLAFLQGK